MKANNIRIQTAEPKQTLERKHAKTNWPKRRRRKKKEVK
jgi:hypothetical protein